MAEQQASSGSHSDETWTLVERRKPSRQEGTRFPLLAGHLRTRLDVACADQELESFWHLFTAKLDQVTQFSRKTFQNFTCYNFERFIGLGIGAFTSDWRAQWQLAWLVALQRYLKQYTRTAGVASDWVLVEPQLTSLEVTLAKRLGFRVFRADPNAPVRCRHCRRSQSDAAAQAGAHTDRVPASSRLGRSQLPHSTRFHDYIRPDAVRRQSKDSGSGYTLLFMPHCGIGLIELVLQLYWDQDALSRLHFVSSDLVELITSHEQRSVALAAERTSSVHGRGNALVSCSDRQLPLAKDASGSTCETKAAVASATQELPSLTEPCCMLALAAQRCIRWIAPVDPEGYRNSNVRQVAFHGLGWQCIEDPTTAALEAIRPGDCSTDRADPAQLAAAMHYIPL
jgi:hypothetical protein